MANKEYVFHLYYIFENWVGMSPKIREIKGGGAKNRQSIWFRTYRHDIFNFYYKEFYVYGEGKKRVPKEIVDWITPRVLAYWFMDDGSKEQSGYSLATHSFCYNDNLILVDALCKLGLDVSIHKDRNKFHLYIKAKDICKFNDLISIYILDCFLYKLHKL